MNYRNQIIDLFKGVAIIAIILYHAGIFTYGYLGVEMFLVIGGFLITKSIMRAYENNNFSYFDYLCKRLVRLWPLALIVSIVSLLIGYFTMLPDAFKNTCETAVGTSSFTNNYVQYITAGNYWDTSNDYKPLMHTWYLGVMFQFYVLYPFLFMLCHRYSSDFIRTSKRALCVVFGLSFIFFILPGTDTTVTFYLLPARLFEFCIGGFIAITVANQNKKIEQYILPIFLFFVVILLCINEKYDIDKVRLLLTVALSALVVLYSDLKDQSNKFPIHNRTLAIFIPLGIASYSLYLWHQVLLALYRYIINNEFTIGAYLTTIGLSLVIGFISYRLIEKPIIAFIRRGKEKTYLIVSLCLFTAVIISLVSIKYYKAKGVVRDIPELEVYLDNPATWEPQEYNARITTLYEKKFPPKNGKKNVLVVGDSYARDWFNIMLESHIEGINLIYSKDVAKDLWKKISEADIIFLANCGAVDTYVDYLPQMMKKRFYRVGYKFFGRTIGVIYNHPRSNHYYEQRIVYQSLPINADERKEFVGMYINLMDSIRNADGSINMFTLDGKLISHDGIHLTKAGAKRFAEAINVNSLINIQDN